MGLSRKLGGGTTSRTEVPVHVDYTWSTQAYTIKDILSKFRLPCVVRCCGEADPVSWTDFRFDMRQPLLLHTARTVRKVHARSLRTQEPSGQLEEFGPPLAIPEDYDGWFFPVVQREPTSLPRHTRVEGVAGSSCRQFLVTTTLPAFTPAKASGAKHVQHEVSIGEVLTKVGVMKGDPSLTSSPSALVQRARHSLRCVDENQHEVIIPFSHRALLFEVAENYGPSTNSGLAGSGQVPARGTSTPGVVHTHTIVAVGNSYLPRVFRHVLGEMPALTHAFTGLLRCYSVFTEETVMAATMSRVHLYSVSQESSCLELATDSSAKFKIALNANELKKTTQYALALKTCEEQAPSYVRAIKTSFTVEPVVSVLDNVDMSLYGSDHEQKMGDLPKVPIQAAVQMSSSNTPFKGENSSTDAVHLDTDNGVADSCDHECLGTDDIRDDESIMTDDAPNSIVDTTSLSDATDILYSDGISDVVEVEASSEFDFSWGQLKRAKSFSGSVSPLTDDIETSPEDSASDSEDSVVIHKDLNSSVSQDSTLTKDANSSASEDTVVFRASAPSPVYANVPKKLSVFSAGQSDAAACVLLGPSDDPSTVDETSTDSQKVDCTLLDNSVRSVWNMPPTDDGQLNCDEKNNSLSTNTSVSPFVGADGSEEVENSICWGDRTEDWHSNSKTAIPDFKGRYAAGDESHFSTLEYPPRIKDKPTATDHGVSTKLPSDSRPGGQPVLVPQPLYSSGLSLQSEGSAQDLAIQRLERALSDATTFLKSSGPPDMEPTPPPRKGNYDRMTMHPTGEIHSGHGGAQCVQPPVHWDTAVSCRSSQTTAAGGLVTTNNPLSTSTSKHSLSDHQTLITPDCQTFTLLDHPTEATISPSFSYGHNTQPDVPHHQSDSHTDSDPATHHHSDGQIDLDFVKALGDRLMAVSRKSSLPKYQRLHPHMDAIVYSENRQFQKKKQRAGLGPRHTAQHGADSFEDGEGKSDTGDAGFSKDWGSVNSTHRDDFLCDLDLLHEEVV